MTKTEKQRQSSVSISALDRGALPRSECRGELRCFGTPGVEAHVLGNGRRMLTTRATALVITGADTGRFGRTIARLPNKPNDFSLEPISFLHPNGSVARGYTAEQVVVIIQTVLRAADAGLTTEHQRAMVEQCRRVSYALMATSLAKMIDEATGYREPAAAVDLELVRRTQREELARAFQTPESRRDEIARLIRAVTDAAHLIRPDVPRDRLEAWVRQTAATFAGVAGLELGAFDGEGFWRLRRTLQDWRRAWELSPIPVRRRRRAPPLLSAPGTSVPQLAFMEFVVPAGTRVRMTVESAVEAVG